MEYQEAREHFGNACGVITAASFRERGIPTVYLTRLVKEGVLMRVGRGLYISGQGDYDVHYFFQQRFKKTIFSYETALYLLGATDKIVLDIDVSVSRNYKFNEGVPGDVNVHYVRPELLGAGVTETKTVFGNPVRVYSFERTLCDFVANRSKMDPETFVRMIKTYSEYKGKQPGVLYKIAAKMKIVKEVRDILEITIL